MSATTAWARPAWPAPVLLHHRHRLQRRLRSTTSNDPNNRGGCGIACGMPTSAALDSGLIGHWKLDEGSGTTSADSSGNGNTATLTGATWTTTGYSGEAVARRLRQLQLRERQPRHPTSAPTARSPPAPGSTPPPPPQSTDLVFGVTSIPNGGPWNMPFLSIAGPTVYGWLWGVPGIDYTASPLAATVQPERLALPGHHLRPLGLVGNRQKFYVDGALAGTAVQRLPAFGSGSTPGRPTFGTPSRPPSPTPMPTSTARSTRCAPAAARSAPPRSRSSTATPARPCSSSTCGGRTGGEAALRRRD